LVGCGASVVREDRTIPFSSDERHVAFQHGRDGIFIAETDGAEPKKIFQPDADMIAVSAPLWNPTDKRLIFTTAKNADQENKQREGLPAEPEPEGQRFAARPILYTCWLHSEPKDDQPRNVPLFTARCSHPGYVAANLAVRWHPDGQHVLYVKQDDEGLYGLHEFDLQTERSRLVFPHRGNDLIFDWAPDNTQLVCVLSDITDASSKQGIWIGQPEAKEWWHVPDSSPGGYWMLEDLLAVRPVWTLDASRFAFVTKHDGENEQQRTYTVHRGELAARTVTAIHKDNKAIRDIHWKPDGERLGFLCGMPTGVFRLADVGHQSARAVGLKEYVRFTGWDASGEQLAFVARQALPHDPAKSWAFLFLPDENARQGLLVAPDADPSRTKTVFAGLQITFPHWSANEAKLSLWATFRPAYRSWLSHLIDLGGDERDPLRGLTLRPGDPALVLDPATGERSWKAINAHEKTQVGHYHLLHREYAEAWSWYEQAAAGVPNAADRSPHQFVQRFVRGRDALLFQAFCLEKLGRTDEAQNKRRQFDETFLPDLPAAPKAPDPNHPAPFGAADIQPTPEQLRHWRDLYVAEVYLSLDAVEEGERYFRAGLHAANTDADRLSKALVLTQFLLLREKHEEYAELATDTVLPLLLRAWKPRVQSNTGQQQANLILAYSDGLSLLPLFSPEFLAKLPEKQVRSLVPRWQKQQAAADDDVKRLGIDLFLEAAARRLGQTDEERAAAHRIAVNPARQDILGDKGVTEFIDGVRHAPKYLAELHDKIR
jgi:hypothetical protein